MAGIKLHPDISLERVLETVERASYGRVGDAQTSFNNPGFCIACGKEVFGVEPDAREYRCEVCEVNGVFGAEEILIEFAL